MTFSPLHCPPPPPPLLLVRYSRCFFLTSTFCRHVPSPSSSSPLSFTPYCGLFHLLHSKDLGLLAPNDSPPLLAHFPFETRHWQFVPLVGTIFLRARKFYHYRRTHPRFGACPFLFHSLPRLHTRIPLTAFHAFFHYLPTSLLFVGLAYYNLPLAWIGYQPFLPLPEILSMSYLPPGVRAPPFGPFFFECPLRFC